MPVVNPVVRVSVPSPAPVVFVSAPAAPAIVRVQSLGTQGPPGPQGVAGPPGTDLGFGSIRYAEDTTTISHTLLPGVRTLFTLTVASIIDNRKAPFAGFTYWGADNVLRNRLAGDIFLIRMRMLATATVAGGSFHMEFVQATPAQPLIASYDKQFIKAAGATESIDPQFTIPTQQPLTDNGGQFYMQSSVPVTLVNEIMVIIPISVGG